MSISLSTNLLVVRTEDSVKFVDPRTNSILSTIETESRVECVSNESLLCCSAKNMCTAYDIAGNELWKQHMGGDSQIINIYHLNGFHIFIFRNKEIRIYSQISEIKLELEVFGNSILITKLLNNTLAVCDDLQHNINLFLIEDLLQAIPKPYKTLSYHSSTINSIALNTNIIASVSSDKSLIIHDHNQIIYQTTLPSEPKCIDLDFDYVYVGCSNGSIHQIKYNNHSQNYNIQPMKQQPNQKILIGHLSEVSTIKLFYDEGKTVLVSCSNDGQLFFWQLETQQLQKKILTLKALTFSLVPRPNDLKQQSEDQILFKIKKSIQLKPIKKTKYNNISQVICKKRWNKQKIEFQFSKFQQVGQDPQMNEILEENQKLKQVIHSLI